MVRRDTEAPIRARVPANVERQDSILFGFTFRQVVILTVAALIIYAAWTALARVVHPLAFLIGAIPLAGFAFVLAVGRRDGIPLDAWLARDPAPPRPAPARPDRRRHRRGPGVGADHRRARGQAAAARAAAPTGQGHHCRRPGGSRPG